MVVIKESRDLAPALRGDGASPTDAVRAGTNSLAGCATRHRECALV